MTFHLAVATDHIKAAGMVMDTNQTLAFVQGENTATSGPEKVDMKHYT